MSGKVYLVGAGPGDPDLLTLKAARLLSSADAIVCDRLVSNGVLEHGNPRAQWHYMGKRAGCSQLQQEEINHLLLKLAQEGKTVVRLKGGDPFIFGRGGEEMLFLAEHGVPVEIVPGISAAMGCAASLGVPLTQRGMATSLRFITGHLSNDATLDLDWRSLADPDCTLVFYMAMGSVGTITTALMDNGLPQDMPAMLARAATTPQEQAVVSTLRQISNEAEHCKPPALLIVGKVVALYTERSNSEDPGSAESMPSTSPASLACLSPAH